MTIEISNINLTSAWTTQEQTIARLMGWKLTFNTLAFDHQKCFILIDRTLISAGAFSNWDMNKVHRYVVDQAIKYVEYEDHHPVIIPSVWIRNKVAFKALCRIKFYNLALYNEMTAAWLEKGLEQSLF